MGKTDEKLLFDEYIRIPKRLIIHLKNGLVVDMKILSGEETRETYRKHRGLLNPEDAKTNVRLCYTTFRFKHSRFYGICLGYAAHHAVNFFRTEHPELAIGFFDVFIIGNKATPCDSFYHDYDESRIELASRAIAQNLSPDVLVLISKPEEK